MNQNIAKQIMQLATIETVAKDLGFKTELHEKNATHEIDTLYVQVESDSKGRNRIFIVNFYPVSDELDDTDLVQFFMQFPFVAQSEPGIDFYKLLCHCSRMLPLGHLNYISNDKSIFYRYVHSIPAYQNIDDSIKETLVLLAYSTLLFEESFEKILQADVSFEDVLAELQQEK